MTSNYDSARHTLLNFEKLDFTGDDDARLDAAKQLSAGGLDELLVIADYRWTQGHFDMTEPCAGVESTLNRIWDDNIGRYQGMNPEQFLDEVARHYLGRVPERGEVLPEGRYQKIAHAFQAFIVPGMVMGRVDGFFARDAPEYTLQRILTGYEQLRDLSKPQP